MPWGWGYMLGGFGGGGPAVIPLPGNLIEGVTTHGPADIMSQWLVDNALGHRPETGDWPIYTGQLPDQGREAIATYDTLGNKDGRPRKTLIHPGVQIRIRGTSYRHAWTKAAEIFDKLEEVAKETIVVESTSYFLSSVSLPTQIIRLGVDQQRRYSFTVNALLTISEFLP